VEKYNYLFVLKEIILYIFQTPPSSKRNTDIVKRNGSYGTLPKEMIVRNKEEDREHRRSRGFPSFGKALLRIKSTKRSCSAPNLGDIQVSSVPPAALGHVTAACIHVLDTRAGITPTK